MALPEPVVVEVLISKQVPHTHWRADSTAELSLKLAHRILAWGCLLIVKLSFKVMKTKLPISSSSQIDNLCTRNESCLGRNASIWG